MEIRALIKNLEAEYKARESSNETTRTLAYVRIALHVPEIVDILKRVADEP